KKPLKEKRPLISVRSPLVGTFYRAPSPEEKPYVEVGDEVVVGQGLCVIEAMKVMNEITSEAEGRIKEILVKNGHPVEYDQELFLIEGE
ncbi:acetyl-CoA carboxylase biotin carboxyl carrier protein, partial [Candidatus Aerophobetes bacterium]|nr:acetyl-CoA carboxylase biotin carboxyl carrier protein [Candidatus Aerophobetes bacterium]